MDRNANLSARTGNSSKWVRTVDESTLNMSMRIGFGASRATARRRTRNQLDKLIQSISKLGSEVTALRKENANDSKDMEDKARLAAIDIERQALLVERDALLCGNDSLENLVTARQNEGRILQEEITDLKGRIRVALRVRNLLPGEVFDEDIDRYQLLDHELRFDSQIIPGEFTHLWKMGTDQSGVFEDVRDFVQSALNGKNVSIIFYGETRSGKTFTMLGTKDDGAGLLPRTVAYLFKQHRSNYQYKYEFSINCYEIYNEKYYDLLECRTELAPKFTGGMLDHSCFAKRPIKCFDEALECLKEVGRWRTTGSTSFNASSSRSHCVIRLLIHRSAGISGEVQSSTLMFVDLAGSERVGASHSSRIRFTEATNINKSLLALRCVMRAHFKGVHSVPYRNSKLTMALANCLGVENSRTFLIVAVSPSVESAAETRRSINFASEACMAQTIGEMNRPSKRRIC